MADITKELNAWKNASKGEDVRDAQIDLSKKVNAEVEKSTKTVSDYESAETGRVDAEKARVTAETKRQTDTISAISASETATQNATDVYNRLKDIDVTVLITRIQTLEDTAITKDTPIIFDDGN